MNQRQRGWTLPELLVVIVILALLLAVSGLLLAPRLKAKAVESRIRGDLRQIAVATNLYVSENDGAFPLSFRAYVMPQAPHYCEGCSRYSPVAYEEGNMLSPTVRNPYTYAWTKAEQKMQALAAGRLRYTYDPNTFPLFTAPWYRQAIVKEPREFSSGPGVYESVVWPTERVMSVWLDGSIHWVNRPENWQLERAGLVGLLMR